MEPAIEKNRKNTNCICNANIIDSISIIFIKETKRNPFIYSTNIGHNWHNNFYF